LVDGEIDVDRADYLLRDGRALGFEFAAYDIDRLIGNLVLVSHPILGLTSAVEERGFSALETFYVSRARSNQFLVRHHKVAQIGAAFRFLSAKAFENPDCAEFLEILASLGSDQDLSDSAARKLLIDIGGFDDAWWTQILKKETEATSPLLKNCKGLVLSREFTLKSIWKRKGDIPSQSLAHINAYLAQILRGAASELARLRHRLEANDLLISVHRFSPYKIRESSDGESLMHVRLANGQLRSVADHSPLLRSLVTAWNEDIHLHVFGPAIGTPGVSKVINLVLPKSRQSRRKKVGKIVRSRLHR
jgi:HD superfamily phosphohydrolase